MRQRLIRPTRLRDTQGSSGRAGPRRGIYLPTHAIAALLLVGLAASCARRPVKLRWKLEPGKTYVYRSEVTGTWEVKGWKGGEFGNLLETEMNVLEVGADSAFRIKEVVRLTGKDVEFEPTVYVYRMSPNGKLYGLESAEFGNSPRVFASKERAERFFEQTQPTYPARALAPGETWVQETKVVLDDRIITATNEFNVRGWEKVADYTCLRIDYTSRTVVPYERKGRAIVDRGTAKGSIWFAPQEGLLVQQVDSFYVASERVMPEGQKPPGTYIVQSVRTYRLIEVR